MIIAALLIALFALALTGCCVILSRAAIDTAASANDLSGRILDDWSADGERWRSLVDRVLTSTNPAPQTLTRTEPDIIAKAITEMAGGNPQLRAMMARQAMNDKRMDLSDEQIAARIYTGVADDDGIPA